MHHDVRFSRQPQPHRQTPTRAGANRNEQIHVARHRFERAPAGLVEPRTENKLHRRREQKLNPRGQHPVFAKQIADHWQHQRRGQQEPNRNRHKPGPRRGRIGVVRLCSRARLIARIAHRTAQAPVVYQRGVERDARRLRSEIDRSGLHTRLLL